MIWSRLPVWSSLLAKLLSSWRRQRPCWRGALVARRRGSCECGCWRRRRRVQWQGQGGSMHQHRWTLRRPWQCRRREEWGAWARLGCMLGRGRVWWKSWLPWRWGTARNQIRWFRQRSCEGLGQGRCRRCKGGTFCRQQGSKLFFRSGESWPSRARE